MEAHRRLNDGNAVRAAPVARKEPLVTTKLWNSEQGHRYREESGRVHGARPDATTLDPPQHDFPDRSPQTLSGCRAVERRDPGCYLGHFDWPGCQERRSLARSRKSLT